MNAMCKPRTADAFKVIDTFAIWVGARNQAELLSQANFRI
jgi:hypothetical protein